MSSRDWAYVCALLAPFVLTNLALKAVRVASLPSEHGILRSFLLVRSDLLFNLGYALLWVGLFAVARKGVARWTVVGLFHAATIVVALVTTGAHQFFKVTGSALDAPTILFFLSSPGGVGAVVLSEVTPELVALLLATLLYLLFGPWLLTRLLGRRMGWTRAEGETSTIPWTGFAGVVVLAYALFSLALLPGGGPGGASETFARDAFVNVAVSEVQRLGGGSLPYAEVQEVRKSLPKNTKLEQAEGTRKRSVVLIHMESTRARSVTPYNSDLETTPFLDELSKQSIFAEQAYAVVPHTTNALVATICGVDPPTRLDTVSVGDDIPARCLPQLLGDEGYNSVYFTSSVQTFERRPEVVKQMGYNEFYPVETMDKEGFQEANYFGYEDDVMLEPSKEWLEKNGDEPFIATYETITPHHQYLAPDRYGRKDFAEDDTLNRYQNSVRYMDFFVKNIIDQYKEMGFYEDTVFVVYGDHGEAFGEHDRSQHDNVIWEEGMNIPLMIVDPARPEGERIQKPVTQLDILPTVADLLGYKITGGEYPGYSFSDLPEDRILMLSCWYENKCLASLQDDKKYIYHYGNQPDEFYDLTNDPLEKDNIIDEVPPEEIKARREALLDWRARADAAYLMP